MMWNDFALRMAVALSLGGLIGTERQLRQRKVGLRTNMLAPVQPSFFFTRSARITCFGTAFFRLIARLPMALALGTSVSATYAGRPMVVDDATVTNAKGCQLETWLQKTRDSDEYWVLPACNFSGNLELALGTGRIAADDLSQTIVVMQAKTLLKPLETNGWGIGLSVANQYDQEKSVAGDLSVNVPLSFSFKDDRLLVHVNSGWLHKRDRGRDLMTWGVGFETQLTKSTGFMSEVYRQDVGKPFFQLGIRHQLIPDRMQVDATYGNRLSSGGNTDQFFSIGIVLAVDGIMP